MFAAVRDRGLGEAEGMARRISCGVTQAELTPDPENLNLWDWQTGKNPPSYQNMAMDGEQGEQK